MKTWIFQGNPDKFNIDEYLRKSKEIYWSVTKKKHQHEISIGDLVYIWRSKGSQKAISGIIAVGVISEECKPKDEVLNSLNLYENLWIESFSETSEIKAGVKIKEIRMTPQDGMVTADELLKDPILSQMQILKARVGSNFLLNENQSRIIETYWNALNLNYPQNEEISIQGYEGKIKLRLHKVRERDAKLRKKAIENFLKQHQKVYCEVCGFSFEEKYGEIGKDFIEVHHLKPIASYSDNETTSLDNLKLVCSNCHRMIHKGDPYSMFYLLKERHFKH